jgi:hypothetical protein
LSPELISVTSLENLDLDTVVITVACTKLDGGRGRHLALPTPHCALLVIVAAPPSSLPPLKNFDKLSSDSSVRTRRSEFGHTAT